MTQLSPGLRAFVTGATRNSDIGKLDYDGALSPLVLDAYVRFLHFHRHLEDGSVRDADNWKKGIPVEAYRKSLWRHFMDAWRGMLGMKIEDNLAFALLGVIFNASGALHELIKADPGMVDKALAEMTERRQKTWDAAKETRVIQPQTQTRLIPRRPAY